MNEIPDGHSHVIAHSTVTPENPQKERWTTSAWWGILKDSIRKIVAPCSNYLSSPPQLWLVCIGEDWLVPDLLFKAGCIML